jgi:hypothetical protein
MLFKSERFDDLTTAFIAHIILHHVILSGNHGRLAVYDLPLAATSYHSFTCRQAAESRQNCFFAVNVRGADQRAIIELR